MLLSSLFVLLCRIQTAVIDSTYLAKKYMEDEGEHGGRGGIVVNIASMGGKDVTNTPSPGVLVLQGHR